MYNIHVYIGVPTDQTISCKDSVNMKQYTICQDYDKLSRIHNKGQNYDQKEIFQPVCKEIPDIEFTFGPDQKKSY